MLDPIFFTISFIYNRKSKGPKNDPCGTPANIKFQVEDAPDLGEQLFVFCLKDNSWTKIEGSQ